MENIIIVLLIVLLVLVMTIKSSLNKRITDLESRILDLRLLLEKRQEPPATPKKAPEAAPVTLEKEALPREIIERQPEVITPPVVAPPPVHRHAAPAPKPYQPILPPEPRPSFFSRHPDLEKFIGENLVNKIGIAILVLAIGYFVKYAIDQDWVGPGGRVAIGLVCGGILIALAHRMRNTYKAFSSVLTGGGLAVFYFTITLAFQQFHLFGQATAFAILIGITVFAVVLSLLYDRQEIAVIALLGGLGSPFMVSTGTANYHALCIYLVLLNTGLLVISWYKAWRILNASAFALTVIVFAGVVYSLRAPAYSTGFLYASILYGLYVIINIAYTVKEGKKFIASDFTILLVNNALYFGTGLYLLTCMEMEPFRGAFAAALGVINLFVSWLLFRNQKVDKNILYLFIGITLTFISLAAPIQLHGHTITLFWASEAVLLYWLYQRSNIRLVGLGAMLIWSAMALSLLMDWWNIYGITNSPIPIIANKGFVTSMVSGICTGLLGWLVQKGEVQSLYRIKPDPRLFNLAAVLILFTGGGLEIHYQFLFYYPGTHLQVIYLLLYLPAFVCLCLLVGRRLQWQVTPSKVTWMLFACVLIYFLHIPAFYDCLDRLLVKHAFPPGHFMAHWAGAVFVGVVFYSMIRQVNKISDGLERSSLSWIIAAAAVAFLSVEASLAANGLFYNGSVSLLRIQEVYVKTGLPILWGLLSFVMMWLGMRQKNRNLRIISLTLFTVTLVKLFIFDIIDIPAAGKIAAFFCLGVLLLIISFMYQKVKKIIVADEPKDPG